MADTMAQVIALALKNAGVKLATHVPGHGATQTFEAFQMITSEAVTSFHEEAAYAVAQGAALTGMRSACIIKSHGLAKAMNAAMDSMSCGVTAGMVNLVFEDKGGAHSDNIIETVPLIAGAEMPFSLSHADTIYEDVLDAMRQSEKLSLPYTLVLNSDEIDDPAQGFAATLGPPPVYQRDPVRHLVCPVFAPYQREVFLSKLKKDLKTFPARPQMPMLPDGLPLAYQEAVSPYLPLFEAFKTLQTDFVCGDAGVSTLSALPPYNITHAALYMGGSIPTAIGAYLAGMKRSWSFIGDFSFIAAGHYGLIEAILRNIPLKVMIFVNGRAQTTGGQAVDLKMLARLLRGYEEVLLRIDDPSYTANVHAILNEANDANGLRIIIANFT